VALVIGGDTGLRTLWGVSLSISNTSKELSRWWHPVARSDELGDEPIRVSLLGVSWAVARTPDGLLALVDRCPHRRAPLSAGRMVDDELACPYHGWRFGADGGCRLIPALGPGARLPTTAKVRAAWGVSERYGLIWLAPEEPMMPIMDVPDWDDPERSRIDMDVFSGRYGAALLIDNQLDMGHFPFVHAGTFGSPDGEVVSSTEMTRDPWGFTLSTQIPITATNDPAALRGEHPVQQYRDMVYRYCAPYSLELRLDYPVMGGSTIITFFAQPETEDRCRLYITLLFQQPGGFGEGELTDRLKFEYQVIAEDLDLQARFDDLHLPLDPGAEVHTRADRASIEFRRILRDVLTNP
jgi:phenylpropionate dioxygenase-like ring-hydroxylating dioxygenase large terminal subunit